jgi:diguanylate cyclase (GGDEF)-like protein
MDVALLLFAVAVGIAIGWTAAWVHMAHRAQHLRDEAERDPLTALRNRRALQQLLHEVPVGVQVAVMLVDLDRFKQINDDHDHHIGDLALIEVARRLNRALADRRYAHAYRIGGDEFAVVVTLGRVLEAQAETAARDLARYIHSQLCGTWMIPDSIDTSTFRSPDRAVLISGSIGVASGTPDRLRALMHAADRGVYQAKNHPTRVFYVTPVLPAPDRPNRRLRDTRGQSPANPTPSTDRNRTARRRRQPRHQAVS